MSCFSSAFLGDDLPRNRYQLEAGSCFIGRQVNVALSQKSKQVTSRVVLFDQTQSLICRVFCFAEAPRVKRHARLGAILSSEGLDHTPARISCHKSAQTLSRALAPVIVTLIGNCKISA